MCQIRARVDGLEYLGDPLLAGLTPLGIMAANHSRADTGDIGAILFGAASG
jgi:hypothetical protein